MQRSMNITSHFGLHVCIKANYVASLVEWTSHFGYRFGVVDTLRTALERNQRRTGTIDIYGRSSKARMKVYAGARKVGGA
jgi:hypothetical protein